MYSSQAPVMNSFAFPMIPMMPQAQPQIVMMPMPQPQYMPQPQQHFVGPFPYANTMYAPTAASDSNCGNESTGRGSMRLQTCTPKHLEEVLPGHLEALDKFIHALNSRDAGVMKAVVEEFCSADTLAGNWNGNHQAAGRDEVVSLYVRIFEAIPDMHLRVDYDFDYEHSSKTHVCAKYTFSGTQRVPLLRIMPVGTYVEIHGHSSFAFNEDDKLSNHTFGLDLDRFTQNSPVLEKIIDTAPVLWQEQFGSRMLQKTIEFANPEMQKTLVRQLSGHVWEASASPNGNYVLQRCIEIMPPDRVTFIVSEMSSHAVEASQHRMQMRVVRRLIEYCPPGQTMELTDPIVASASLLFRHPFGNYILQTIIEYGTPMHRRALAESMCLEADNLARHHIATNVMRKLLIHCPTEDRLQLTEILTADSKLANHKVGSFISKQLKKSKL